MAPAPAHRTIVLSGSGVDIDAMLAVARGAARVGLADSVRARLAAARRVVDELAHSDRAIYGLTTGLGANVGAALSPADLAAFQQRAVMARAVGIGPRLPSEVVRAILFTRIAMLGVGGSGVSPHVAEALVALLNAGVHPAIPSKGSIGVADLAPLAHLALPLVGLGEAEFGGEVLPGGEALRRAGLAPIALGPKDGIALINSNAATVGGGALAVVDALAVLDAVTIAAALSLEGFRGNLSPLDPRVGAARAAPGQDAAAARLRGLLDGSLLWREGAARRVQDPLSLRCVSQVHGAAIWALGLARQNIEIELNGAGDNPLVLVDERQMLSTGNFHIPAFAIAFEAVGLALAQVASLAAERAIKLLSPALSGLPLNLSPYTDGSRSGFAAVQKPLTALIAEIRHLANPACLDFLPVSEQIEDHAPMAPLVVEKTGEIVDRLRLVAAIELMIAAQAVDLRGVATLGCGARAAYDVVRGVVKRLDEDRVLGPEIEAITAEIGSGRLADAVAAAAG
jgi:histidine ammonia-lyase